ncbi:MAG: carboxypeptidase-like regulatory domain-containing protein, partial [Prevotella sp.]|nr:carboxypeptidase-like regulatory domain-containing protein [Prevotella sp.]
MEQKATSKNRILLLLLLSLWAMIPWGGQLSAQNVQKENLTLEMRNVTIDQLFSQIKKQTGYNFVISGELAKSLPKVSVNAQNRPVREVLNQVLGKIGCAYDISGRTITVYRKISDNRDRTIAGYVRDNTGEPMIGVSIGIGDSRVAAVTDDKGHFTMKIPTDACYLKFSYVGMKTIMEPIPAGTATLQRDIVMTDDNQLGEVVVTGIFTKARESYTGAVTTIDKEELDLHKGQNLLQTLKTIDASLNFQVNNLAGSDPNTLPQITIRGNSSLPMSVTEFNRSTSNSVNTQLIILDGFEIRLEKLMDYND